jgi:hypothetical protein
MYDTEDVYKLLNSHNQEFMLNHLVETEKQTTYEEAQKERTKMAVMVPNLTAGL